MTKTKDNLLVKVFVAIAFLLLSIGMSACAKANKNIVKISVVSSTVPAEIEVGKFDEAGIKIKVEYEDGSIEQKDVTLDMVDATNKEFLNKSGSYIVTIKFNGQETTFNVNVVESAAVHTVKFYNAYGYMIYRDDNVKHGGASTLPSEALRKCEGYTFVEWDRATDNITGDTNVYGVYYKVDSSLTDAELEAKLLSANEYFFTTTHTSTLEEAHYDNNSGTMKLNSTYTYRHNYHYTSLSNFSLQMVSNDGTSTDMTEIKSYGGNMYTNTYLYEDDTWTCASVNVTDYNTHVEYFGGERALLAQAIMVGFNLNEQLEICASQDSSQYTNIKKTYTFKKYTNGKNIYNATLEYRFVQDAYNYDTYVYELVYDDTKLLSFKQTINDHNGSKSESTMYIDYVEKEFVDIDCGVLDTTLGLAKAKSLMSALKTTKHTLVKTGSSSDVFTYVESIRGYKNSDASVIIPLIGNFEDHVDDTVSLDYSKLSETKFKIQVSLNGKLYDKAEYVSLTIENDVLTAIEYYTPSVTDAQGTHLEMYNFNVNYTND
mgnify:CR=1 FL=1